MSKGDSELTRRKFLSTAAAGLAGVGMMNLSPAPVTAQVEKDKKIIYRRLGKSGPEIPVISFGTSATVNPGLIQASFEKGFRHYATSAGYNYGNSERMIGTVLKKMGVRDKVSIGTMDAMPQKFEGLSVQKSREKTIKAVEASLRRLQTDYIDIIYLAQLDTVDMVNNPGILEGLVMMKEQKKVLQIGMSTHVNMARVINEAVKNGTYEVIMVSLNFTMADDKNHLDAIANAAENGIGIIAMKTQAGGTRWPNPQSRRKYPNSTIMTAALKWALNNKNVSTCVPAITDYEMLDEDFSVAYDIEYTPEEREFLKDNKAVLSIGFCRQCRKCLASCPKNVDIPTLMRTHMYTAQYGDFHYARATYDSILEGRGLDACSKCAACVADCANTVDIGRRIDELRLIYT